MAEDIFSLFNLLLLCFQACTLCGVGVEPFYHHITTHLSSFHPEIQKKCPQCEAILYCERALYDHKRNMHSGKEFQCDICEKVSTMYAIIDLTTLFKNVLILPGVQHQIAAQFPSKERP